jgi:hypothetical protein
MYNPADGAKRPNRAATDLEIELSAGFVQVRDVDTLPEEKYDSPDEHP